jgi:hypothetical protein
MNLGDIGNALGGVLSGGLTGIIGVCVQRVSEYKSKQLDVQLNKDKYAHEVDMKKADAEIMAQEWAARSKIATTEAADHEAVADAQAFSTALTGEPQRYSDPSKVNVAQEWLLVILDTVRGLIRPVLTIYLCAITTVVYLQARELLGNQPLGVDQASALLKTIIDTVLYLTVSCVLFWFGSRNKAKPPKV